MLYQRWFMFFVFVASYFTQRKQFLERNIHNGTEALLMFAFASYSCRVRVIGKGVVPAAQGYADTVFRNGKWGCVSLAYLFFLLWERKHIVKPITKYQLMNGKDHLHHIVWMQHYSGQNMIRWCRQVVFVSQVLLRNIRCFFSSFLRDKTKNIMYKAFKCYYETTSFLYFVVLTIIHIVPSHVYG